MCFSRFRSCACDDENGASLPAFARLKSVKTLSSPSAAILESAAEYDLEPVPSEWTDSLLERLDALECECASSGCVCEKASYIRQRTSPPMGRNQFVELACTAGVGHREAGEYYKNYLVDIRSRQHSAESQELLDQICEATRSLRQCLPEAEEAVVLARLKTASQKRHELVKRIYEPLRQ